LQEARAAGTVTDGRLPAKRWIDRQEELAFALRSGSLSALNWHDEVNRIAGEVDVDELMVETSRGLVTTAGAPFMRDPVKRRIRFLNEDGQARHLSYAAATFTFGPENVITPHGHKHMASAHMVVGGKVRIRTFDRISDEENALVIRPTGDHIGEVGSAAAMTTAKDNIHWFSPITSRSVTFDVIVDGLDQGQEAYLIQPVDPLAGLHRSDGTIVAPILTFEESMNRYPAQV
jgi:hypothetical protein